MPFGNALSPLLLQRTTVSKQVHSAGQRARGEQVLSSLPKVCKQKAVIVSIMQWTLYL